MSEFKIIDFWIGSNTKRKRYIVANKSGEIFHKEDLYFISKDEPITQSTAKGLIVYNVNPKNNLYYFAGSAIYFQK